MDIYTGEPKLHPGYLDLDNIFLLPHLGSATIEMHNAVDFKAIDNLDSFFAAERPPDIVS